MQQGKPAQARVDVICETCGLYASMVSPVAMMAIAAQDGSPVQMGNTYLGPCVRCGGLDCRVVSGIVETVKGVTRSIFSSNPAVIAELRGLAKQFQAEPTVTAADAADRIEAQLPELRGLADWLRQNEHLGTWLAVLLSVLALLQARGGGNAPISQQEVETIVRGVVEAQPTASPTSPSEATSLNSRCPCGSGRKYKHCHAHRTTRER